VLRALPLGALAACSFSADYGDTAYHCGNHDECPAGYSCYDGLCLTQAPSVDAAPPASWWDAAWHARRPLVIRNRATAPMAKGYQVEWKIDPKEDLGETDNDAMRLVAYDSDQDLWTEIPRIVDEAAPDRRIWFSLPVALDPDQSESVWLYQDNPDPPSAPWAATDLFELADPLMNVSPDRWVTEGAVVDEGDELRFDETAEMRSTEPWQVDRAVDIVARAGASANRFWFGFQREEPDFLPDVPWAVWIRREPSDAMLPEYAGPTDSLETRWSGSTVAVGTQNHVFTVERLVDRVVYRFDYELAGADHDHALASDHSAPLYLRFSNTSSGSFWASRVRVRQIVYPRPDVVLGAREDL
jgi:hypothetical protein